MNDLNLIAGSHGRRKRRPVARRAVSAYKAPDKFDTPDGVFGRLG